MLLMSSSPTQLLTLVAKGTKHFFDAFTLFQNSVLLQFCKDLAIALAQAVSSKKIRFRKAYLKHTNYLNILNAGIKIDINYLVSRL